MTEPRSRKLERLVRVQRQLERLAEIELALTLRERTAIEEKKAALVVAVGSLDPVHRSMAGHYARRFGGLEGKIRQLDGLQAVQERRVLAERTKADRLAESASNARETEDRSAADEALLDLLDASLGPGRTSPA